MIITLDPVINPDGRDRHTHWANMHKGTPPVADPNDREHNEIWPGGRFNHYWFDLNRDWLLLQHPESQARITQFHRWRPQIVADFHEMGTNSTFFFQPGVPSRVHPLTPKKNFELTEKIGTYHAKALDQIGSLYYNQENYDDFYYGKGSTYPDVQGSVGILFEQASSRGHLQETDNGMLSFPFTIRNQFTTTLSTLEAAQASLRNLAAQAHGEVLTQLVTAWAQRDAAQLPAAQALGTRVNAAQRNAWAQSLGKPAAQAPAEALLRLDQMVQAAAHVPRTRRATKPTHASKLRRLQGKTQRGAIKAGRAKPSGE